MNIKNGKSCLIPYFLFSTTHDAQYFAEPILLAAKTVILRTHEPTSPDILYDFTFVNFFPCYRAMIS